MVDLQKNKKISTTQSDTVIIRSTALLHLKKVQKLPAKQFIIEDPGGWEPITTAHYPFLLNHPIFLILNHKKINNGMKLLPYLKNPIVWLVKTDITQHSLIYRKQYIHYLNQFMNNKIIGGKVINGTLPKGVTGFRLEGKNIITYNVDRRIHYQGVPFYWITPELYPPDQRFIKLASEIKIFKDHLKKKEYLKGYLWLQWCKNNGKNPPLKYYNKLLDFLNNPLYKREEYLIRR